MPLDGEAKAEYNRAHYQQNKTRWRLHYEANKAVYLDRAKRRKLEIANFIRESKQGSCCDCGNEYPHYVMQYDHVAERGPKLFEINRATALGVGIKKLRGEIAKCDLVCANCHAARTYMRISGSHGRASG